jgi:hypothetical protein
MEKCPLYLSKVPSFVDPFTPPSNVLFSPKNDEIKAVKMRLK